MLRNTFLLSSLIIISFSTSSIEGRRRLFRKSDLFLAQDAIAGVPEVGIAPEDFIAPATGEGFVAQSPILVQAAVLEGNYPTQGSMEIPALNAYDKRQEEMRNAKNKSAKKSQQEDEIDLPIKINRPLIDPIRKILVDAMTLDGDSDTAEGNGTQTKTNGTGDGEEASFVPDMSLLKDGSAAFSKKVLDCKENLRLCSLTNTYNVKCYLNCLLDKHPVGHIAIGTISGVIKSLCNPIGTVFDKGVPLFVKNAEQVETANDFLTLFQVGDDFYKQYARHAANAIPTILMKYSLSKEAQLLKKTINSLETAVKSAVSGFNAGENKMLNDACPSIHSVDAVQSLVNLFYRTPKSFDTLFLGSWAISRIFRITTQHKLHSLTEGFAGALKIIAGLETGCGLVLKGVVGEDSECEPEEIIEWDKGKIVKAEKGKAVICGSMPYFPQSMYDEIYPSVFYQKPKTSPKTTTTEAPPQEGRPEVAVNLEPGWTKQIDNILKANIEYDDDE